MMKMRASAVSSIAALASLPAQTLIWPGEPIAVIEGVHVRAYVPFASAEKLKSLVARADQIYALMMADAGFVEGEKLRLLVADWFDAHNGFSFVVPFPLVQVELAPSPPESTIFAGGNDAERTLVHEFAHQISNDRNGGVRGVFESIFGRVLPNDLLSLLVWYVSTPAHQTMPRFWQEGLAMWAETSYADPDSAWAGRGRDSLTHMVWRLDAAANAIPRTADWRITFHEWPFGGAAYAYGLAYTRFLQARLGNRGSVWQLVENQARQWAFAFDRGLRGVVGSRHGALLEQAREALLAEQHASLATLRAAKVTTPQRLTPDDMVVSAPAWLPDGSLVFAGHPAQGRARLHTLAPDGTLSSAGTTTLAQAPVRAVQDGGIVYHEFNWRGISHVVVDGLEFGRRLLQPDVGAMDENGREIAAIQLRQGGGQELVVHPVIVLSLFGRFLARTGELVVVPTQGTPWSPAFRPGVDGALVWVETDTNGSRLVLGSARDTTRRTVLWTVRGRLLHPCWTSDGASLYVCADHTGVANAYRLTLQGAKAEVVPVTNTIGGVIACVPSPDGKMLALVDHDERGPFVAKLPADPAAWAEQVPSIPLAWPAPVASDTLAALSTAQRPTPIPPLPPGAADALTAVPYSGLAELQPLFWAPSTFAVPEGGYGAYGLLADPLFTHVVQAGAGVGLVEHEPVGFLAWDYLAMPIEVGASIGRAELTFADSVHTGPATAFDYTETVAHGEVRVGRGLFALERTFLLHGSFGVEDHDEVDDAARLYQGLPQQNPPAFRGTEQYAELTIGYDDTTFYPTSYAAEDGARVLAVYRHSGFAGELERNLAFGDVGYTASVWPTAGHQVTMRAQLGWSDGDELLQGNFSVGGGLSRGLPRGYFDAAVATGRHLLGGSLAWRLPLYRPFAAANTTPFRARQFALELFGDTCKVSSDRFDGDGEWFTSVGAELHANVEFADNVVSPGLGVAWQLDGDRDVQAWFTLGFAF